MVNQLDKFEIGKRCRAARNRAELTLKDMAERLGYKSAAAVSNKENGLAYPSAEDLFFLSQQSGCSIDWLITGEGADDGLGALSPWEVQLLEDYRFLNEFQKRELLHYVFRLKYGIKETIKTSDKLEPSV